MWDYAEWMGYLDEVDPGTDTQDQGDKLALKIYLTDEAARWMWGFVHAVDTEIGGFGYCTSPDPGIVVVDTILLAPQEVSGAGVDFKDDAMMYMIEKAAEDGRLEDARFSWHSHVNMGVYWSNTDEEGVRDYEKSGMPWLVSVVANKKGEAKGRLDVFDVPLVGHATFNNNIDVIELRDNSLDDQIAKEIEHFVEKKVYQSSTKGSTTGSSNRTGEKSDEEPAEKDETGKELALRRPIQVDSTMDPQEFVLWQKFLAGEQMTDEEEALFEKYVDGEIPEVVDGEAVVLG